MSDVGINEALVTTETSAPDSFLGVLENLAEAEKALRIHLAIGQNVQTTLQDVRFVEVHGTKTVPRSGVEERLTEATLNLFEWYQQAFLERLAERMGVELPDDLFVDHRSNFKGERHERPVEHLFQPGSFGFALDKLVRMEE